MSEPNQDACGCDNTHKPAFTSRRQFLSRFGMGLAAFALAEMLARNRRAQSSTTASSESRTFRRKPSESSTCSCQAGRRSLTCSTTSRCSTNGMANNSPTSVRGGQRLTGMSGNQSSIPLVGSPFKFTQQGPAGAWFSELLPAHRRNRR